MDKEPPLVVVTRLQRYSIFFTSKKKHTHTHAHAELADVGEPCVACDHACTPPLKAMRNTCVRFIYTEPMHGGMQHEPRHHIYRTVPLLGTHYNSRASQAPCPCRPRDVRRWLRHREYGPDSGQVGGVSTTSRQEDALVCTHGHARQVVRESVWTVHGKLASSRRPLDRQISPAACLAWRALHLHARSCALCDSAVHWGLIMWPEDSACEIR